MADIKDSIFRNRKVNVSRLEPFGFVQSEKGMSYVRIFTDSGFELKVTITLSGEVSTELTDPAFNEPYTLHLDAAAVGEFIGAIRSEYEKALREIAEKCFEPDVFKSRQTNELIDYVRKTYGDELEFLWRKSPCNAVWRRKDTTKWYAILLTVSKRRLGLESDEIAEIIDLRIRTEKLETLVDNESYFPGYHMNKRHWCTIILDGSVPTGYICRMIDDSYDMAIK